MAGHMKYYYREHLRGYERVRAEGKTAWAEIHGSSGFENFASREFLETVLPQLCFSQENPAALELGCGTGPGACFLAERGFDVDAVDLIPAAIEIAREQACRRGLKIHYEVMDVVETPHQAKRYDLIVDSYCLQGIVTDEDREKLFAAVRSRLTSVGYYLVSTACFDEQRFDAEETITDETTGAALHRYGRGGLIDPATDIAYARFDEDRRQWDDAIEIAGQWYLPVRRHRRPPALKAELTAAGFDVLHQDAGNLVCAHRGAGVRMT